MTLAHGVSFDEERHEYWYKGKQLSGVTGLIAQKLGLKMPKEFLEGYQEEGIHVHKAAQKWIETGNPDSVHPGVAWLVSTFTPGMDVFKDRVYSEVLISDFERYASAIDIVYETLDGGLILYDIKNGNFKRDYVTWQLSIYKYLVEKSGKKVNDCVCISLKDKEYYPIFPKSAEEVEKLLYNNP
jgi:CRISPR/Cas system-associated exonuclease Cas4 (RecB family)